MQLIGALAIAVWSVFWSGLYFFVMNKKGKLRVPRIYEMIGMDYIEHGGSDFVLSKGKRDIDDYL